MILFKGDRGTVLNTGDFRFKKVMLDVLKKDKIDTLYLDNTFATPSEDFPTQEESYKMILDLMTKNLKKNKEFKFNFYCYTLGKEEVFYNLARHFKTKVRFSF